MIQNYAMPFNFSTALHMIAQDVEFMKEVIDMAVKGEIVLTYVESSSTTTETRTYSGYESKKYRFTTDTDENEHVYEANQGIVELPNDEYNTINSNNIGNYITPDYYQKITTTYSGTLYVTKADTWLKSVEKDIGEVSNSGEEVIGTETNEIKNSVTTRTVSRLNEKKVIEETHTTNISETIVTTFESKKYTVVYLENDTNVEAFIKLIESYPNVKDNLKNSPSLMFEWLQQNENTQKLEKVMRYVISMISEDGYGVSEANLKTLFNDLFSNSNLMNGSSIEARVWFALRAAGFSAEATAGIMGNIDAESGFNPSLNEEGSGIGYGLCQWSYGRRTQLEEYALSKGVAPSDVETQIEFLVAELTIEDVEGNAAEEFADYQFSSTSDGQALRDAKTPEEAAEVFCWKFERPNENKAHIEWRTTSAREYYDYFTGIGDANELQVMIVEVINNPDYRDQITGTKNMCLAWTCKVYNVAASELGWTTDVTGPANCASCAGYSYGVSTDMNNIPIGAAVYRGASASGSSAGYTYGHVGIYIGEGKIVHNLNGVSSSQEPAISTVEEWISTSNSMRSKSLLGVARRTSK